MMILHMRLEVLGQVVDALAENRDLNFGRAGIGVVGSIGSDQCGFAIFGQRHLVLPPRTRQNGLSATSAPYADYLLRRASSKCYNRTIEGCKTSAVSSASPISSPRSSSSRSQP